MSTKQKLPRTDKTELRRLHILDAALACFIQQGFHQTSMRDIATAAGVSLGNLYNHFSGKEALIIEIAALEAAELQPLIEGLRAEPDAIVALDIFVRRYLANCMQQETVVLTIEVMAEAVRNPPVAQHFADNRQHLAVALAHVLQRAADMGSAPGVWQAVEAAEAVLDIIEGAAFRAVLLPATAAPAMVETVLRTVQALLGLRRQHA